MGCPSYFSRASASSRLGGVPMSEPVPPMLAAYARHSEIIGRSSASEGSPALPAGGESHVTSA